MEDTNFGSPPRRQFILKVGALLGATALLAPPTLGAAAKSGAAAVEVTPPEDLMREHGVLRRIMLIYDELRSRLQQGAPFPLAALTGATDLIRRFIQDYHEKDEEEYLFTRFNQAGKMVDLVKILYQQHQAGRQVTARLREVSTAANLQKPDQRLKAAALLQSFNRMYRPHAAREDTVLYPAFRSVIPPAEFDALGDVFEDKEQKLFGQNGFEKIVSEVAGLERQLGLNDLAQFTPRV
jgi:hemerythrin-like domain-containing protein